MSSQYLAIDPLAFPDFLRRLNCVPPISIPIHGGPIDQAVEMDLPIGPRKPIAIIHIEGPMLKSPAPFYRDLGFASTLAIQRAVEAARADPAVIAIVLRIDSPGGSVDGLSELVDAIWAARAVKPLIAQVTGTAASAAYQVASQASAIYAQRMDLVGSIGARLMLYDLSVAFEKDGIRAIPIDSSPPDRPFKSAGAMGTPITSAQEKDFQRLVDAFFDDFKASVQRGRRLTDQQFDAVGDGRIWPAADAFRLGLIDGVQTLEMTLTTLESQAPPRRLGARARASAMTASLSLPDSGQP